MKPIRWPVFIVVVLLTAVGTFVSLPALGQTEEYNAAIRFAGEGRFEEAVHAAEKFVEKVKEQDDLEGEAHGLLLLGMIQSVQGNYSDAESNYLTALELMIEIYGSENRYVADLLYKLGYIYHDQGRFPEAISAYEQAISSYEKSLGPEHPDLALVLDGLAGIYIALGRDADALPLVREALRISEKALGSEDLEVAVINLNLASIYYREGRYTEAADLLKRSLMIHERELGSDNPRVARILGDMSNVFRDQGDFNRAESLLERALIIYQNVFGDEHPYIPPILHNLASIYREQGRYDDAELFITRALKMNEQLLGPEHPGTAMTLRELAKLHQQAMRYSEAESFFYKALTIQENVLGPEHPDVGMTLNSISLLYRRQGRYAEAEPIIKRSLTIKRKIYGADHPYFGIGLNELAALYAAQGRYDEAEPIMKQALAIMEKSSVNHADYATTLNNLATVYKSQERYSEAENLLRRALSISEQKLGQYDPRLRTILITLGLLYNMQGRFSDSEPIFNRTLEISERIDGPEHLNVAMALSNLAMGYTVRGRYAEAESNLHRALSIRLKNHDPTHPIIATTYSGIAILREVQGRYVDAVIERRRATSLLRNRFSVGGVKETKGLLGEKQQASWGFRQHAHLVLMLDQPDDRTKLESEAFEVIQLARMSSAADALSRMAARFASGDNEIGNLVRRRQDTFKLLESLDASLIATLRASGKTQNQRIVSRIREQISETRSQLSGFDEVIESKFPEYAEMVSGDPLSLKGAQDLLGNKEALITAFSDIGGYTHLFIIRPDKSKAYTIDLGLDELEEMVTKLRLGLDPSSGQIEAFDVNLAHALYKKLLAPAESMLPGVKHLFVVPDGPLESLPFHLLVTEDPGEGALPGLKSSGQRGFTVTSDTEQATPETEAKYEDVAWLAKKYATTTLPSIASLRALRVFAKKGQATEPFIGFGDPVLEGRQGTSKGLEVASFYRGVVADVDEVRQLSPLPETETELRAMANYLGADEASIYLKERATETQVKQVTLNQSQVVAFSTHGLLSGEIKGLAEPALVLTPPNKGTAQDDGLLTASEVAQLKLDADWVILSACNTAAGDALGASGLSGLAKAFFYAGARALLVSHWPVESHAATKLTTTMFEKIKKNPAIGRAEALRQSMLQLASSKDFAHPFFWAPFVVVGEGGL
jgi:CHAT domain-containing protein/tetratricopeptide (TPR) repeat protein